MSGKHIEENNLEEAGIFDANQLEEITLEEMFKDRRNRFEKWIDKLFGGSLSGYAPHYALSHPHKIVKNWWHEVKWAWQRVFRGWDDRVVWSIDFYLAERIPEWMKSLKENKHGVPCIMFDIEDWDDEISDYKDGAFEIAKEKWEKVMDDIIKGFEAFKIMDEIKWTDDKEYKEAEKVFKHGMSLLTEYYGNFWD